MPARKVPTSLKIATGTFRKDRHASPDTEVKGVKLKKSEPAPATLRSSIEKATWRRLMTVLAPKGLATDLDVSAIIAYCRDERICEKLTKDIFKTGVTIQGDRGSKKNAAYSALDQVHRRQSTFWEKFGMRPHDRIGLTVDWDIEVAKQTADPIQQRDRS